MFNLDTTVTPNGDLWMTGGYANPGWIPQDATMIIYGNNTCEPGVNLPAPAYGHCFVQFNDTHYLLVGGQDRGLQLKYSTGIIEINRKRELIK